VGDVLGDGAGLGFMTDWSRARGIVLRLPAQMQCTLTMKFLLPDASA